MVKKKKTKRCDYRKCLSKDFPLDKRGNYTICRSRYPYSQVDRYVIYDNYNNYQGGGKTKRECNEVIKQHISNNKIIMKQLRKEYCEKQKAKKRKTYKGAKRYGKN